MPSCALSGDESSAAYTGAHARRARPGREALNVQTRLAVLHHHGDDLVEMEETYRDREAVPLDEPTVVIYRCPRCETIVTVGAVTTEVGVPNRPDVPGAP